jgi:hypothetical protein
VLRLNGPTTIVAVRGSLNAPAAGSGPSFTVAVQDPATAALASGGRMVRDQFAPRWWTLADAAGNEVDIATVKDRD